MLFLLACGTSAGSCLAHRHTQMLLLGALLHLAFSLHGLLDSRRSVARICEESSVFYEEREDREEIADSGDERGEEGDLRQHEWRGDSESPALCH